MPTGIEWTEETWNPVLGCSIESAGCANCYAMKLGHRLAAMGNRDYDGLTKPSKGGPVWTGKLNRANEGQRTKPLRVRRPTMWFVNSMSDAFHPEMPVAWRDETFAVMRQAHWHTFQVLTKRPKVAAAYYRERPHLHGLPHVWIGTSVERADVAWRIDALREVPAAIRFLSIEPLIGPVGELDLTGIHWVITGGESGPGARICRPEWVRPIVEACQRQGVALFHKQWGTYRSNPLVIEQGRTVAEATKLDEHGKGGALLDGKLWREMPNAPARGSEAGLLAGA